MPFTLTYPQTVRTFLIFLILLLTPSVMVNGQGFESLGNLIGENESVLVADPDGNILFSKNAEQEMVPASTIKILTCMAAMHFLGKDYRFKTGFYVDKFQNLLIKGFGDPLLISEEIENIAGNLFPLIPPTINDLIVDDSYFSKPLSIPGISSSSRAYNAPNGALCVNFNTVNIRPGPAPGTFVSAEPQTPLLPFALKHIQQSGSQSDRIVLSHNQNHILLYAGHMFKYFLQKKGVKIEGEILPGKFNEETSNLVMDYRSRFTVEQVCKELLEYSNNFIANQLFIATGAEKYGPPGDLKNGIEAVELYAKNQLGIDDITLMEGSGISRDNRISGKKMLRVLEIFKPHYQLMKNEKNVFYKSGTLQGVSNIAGFIQNDKGQLYPFVIFTRKNKKSAFPVMEILRRKIY